MFKELGKLLKKGAMSVEYIVIGVCVIGMAALATAFVSNKMDIAMGQENNAGDTNAGDNQTGNDSNGNIKVDPKTTLEYYGVCQGNYSLMNIEVTEETMTMCSYDSNSKTYIKTASFNFKNQTAERSDMKFDGVYYPVSYLDVNQDGTFINVVVKFDYRGNPSSQTLGFSFYLTEIAQKCQ